MVDAYNPSLPTLTSAVEVSAELRAIKAKLVLHRDAIEAIETDLEAIAGMTAYGKQLLELADAEANLDLLGFGIKMKELVPLDTTEQIINALGIIDPTVVITSGPDKWTAKFVGGLKINIVRADIAAGGTNITWHEPFTTQLFAPWATLLQNKDYAFWVTDYTLAGCRVDHNNNTSAQGAIFAIGI